MYKNITKILIALSALVFTTETASAQDPAFSQFYANPLYLNPAFAGTNICPRVNLNYRDQWPGYRKNLCYNFCFMGQTYSSNWWRLRCYSFSR